MAGEVGRVTLALAGAAAATEEITFGEDGIAEVPLAFLPNQPGDFELQAAVESGADEIHPDVLELRNRYWVMPGDAD